MRPPELVAWSERRPRHEFTFEEAYNRRLKAEQATAPDMVANDPNSVETRREWLVDRLSHLQSQSILFPRGGPDHKAIATLILATQRSLAEVKQLRRRAQTAADNLRREAKASWDPDDTMSLLAALVEMFYDLRNDRKLILDEDDNLLLNDAINHINRFAGSVRGA